MSTKLRFKPQDRHRCDSSMKQSLRHMYVDDKRQREVKNRRKELLARKTRPSSSRLPERNVVESINQSLSGSSRNTNNTLKTTDDSKLSEKKSENSIIYIGTTYAKNDIPRKESIIDLTESNSILSWIENYDLDDYDISGDNIIDELLLKDHVSSAASIFTIFPPQPQDVFSSPSEELCVYQTAREPSTVSSAKKRTLSTSDVTHKSHSNRPKRVASTKSGVTDNKIDSKESSDCIWKLKRSYPLSSALSKNRTANGYELADLETDLASDIDLLEIVDDLEKEISIQL